MSTRIEERFNSLLAEARKLEVAKLALDKRIQDGNEIAELTEGNDLHKLVKSGRKINKKGEYRMGGKVNRLSPNQMDIYRKRYATSGEVKKIYQPPGGQRRWPTIEGGQKDWSELDAGLQHQIYKARNLTIPEYALGDGEETVVETETETTTPELVSDANLPEPPNSSRFGEMYTFMDDDLTLTTKFWDEMSPAEKRNHYNEKNIEIPTVVTEEETTTVDPGADTSTTTTTTASTSAPAEKVDQFRLTTNDQGEYALGPDDGYINVLGFTDPADYSTFKGVKSYNKTTNEIEFTNDEAGELAKQIMDQGTPDDFANNYIKAANQEQEDAGIVVSYDDLYKYSDAIGLTDKKLKKYGKDKKYGKEHKDLLEAINVADFQRWEEKGNPTEWKVTTLPANTTDTEGEGTEIITGEQGGQGGQGGGGGVAGTGTAGADAKADAKAEFKKAIESIDTKLTGGEKLGLATGALGRIGGIAAALYNKPEKARNSYLGVSNRAEDTMKDTIRQSRIGFEQTEAQIKAQGNLARGIARDTSNSWSQRYAAALGTQRVTDKGLTANRNAWEKMYGTLKGQQAQIQFKGDAMEAQGDMQVQDWWQRDKDAFAGAMAQEAQNLTSYGASVSNVANMKKLRAQQLEILANTGTYYTLGQLGHGIYGIEFGGNKDDK